MTTIGIFNTLKPQSCREKMRPPLLSELTVGLLNVSWISWLPLSCGGSSAFRFECVNETTNDQRMETVSCRAQFERAINEMFRSSDIKTALYAAYLKTFIRSESPEWQTNVRRLKSGPKHLNERINTPVRLLLSATLKKFSPRCELGCRHEILPRKCWHP